MAITETWTWGSAVQGDYSGLQGKLGIYIKKNESDYKVDVTVQVWFASIYALHDGDGVGNNQNKLLYSHGENVVSATTDLGEHKIYHTHNTGSGWNSNNRTCIHTASYSHNRGDAAKTFKIYARFNDIDVLNYKPVYVDASYTVPALDLFTITYYPNGVTWTNWSSISSQKKKRGVDIALASVEPAAKGYKCKGWCLAQTAGGTFYDFGQTYTKDASAEFYASWIKEVYTIKYDKNAPDAVAGLTSQTQEYGTSIKLTTNTPTRPNYNFLGWATTANATEATYKPGDSYQPNENITLYAVWELNYIKPSITKVNIERCDENGNPDEEGTSCSVSFSWKLFNNFNSGRIRLAISASDGKAIANFAKDINGTEGEFSKTVLANNLLVDIESSYIAWIMVSDGTGSNSITKNIRPVAYPIDILREGKGIAFGKPAKKSGVMDIGFKVDLGASRLLGLGDVLPLASGTDLNTVTEPGVYSIPNAETFTSLVNYPAKCTTYRAGRLEVWTSHGANTDKENYNRHIIQRFTNLNSTSIWTRYIQYTPADGWTVIRDWENDALRAYPVNSIYISYSHTSPAELFGGTWTRISPYFLYGTGSTGVIGETGGENSHVLTVNEMPSHQHFLLNYNVNGTSADYSGYAVDAPGTVGWGGNVKTAFAGGGAAHNNLPPFIKVSIWRRTA